MILDQGEMDGTEHGTAAQGRTTALTTYGTVCTHMSRCTTTCTVLVHIRSVAACLLLSRNKIFISRHIHVLRAERSGPGFSFVCDEGSCRAAVVDRARVLHFW